MFQIILMPKRDLVVLQVNFSEMYILQTHFTKLKYMEAYIQDRVSLQDSVSEVRSTSVQFLLLHTTQ